MLSSGSDFSELEIIQMMGKNMMSAKNTIIRSVPPLFMRLLILYEPKPYALPAPLEELFGIIHPLFENKELQPGQKRRQQKQNHRQSRCVTHPVVSKRM